MFGEVEDFPVTGEKVNSQNEKVKKLNFIGYVIFITHLYTTKAMLPEVSVLPI